MTQSSSARRRVRQLMPKYMASHEQKQLKKLKKDFLDSVETHFPDNSDPIDGGSYPEVHEAVGSGIEHIMEKLEPVYTVVKVNKCRVAMKRGPNRTSPYESWFECDTRYQGFENKEDWQPADEIGTTKAFDQYWTDVFNRGDSPDNPEFKLIHFID